MDRYLLRAVARLLAVAVLSVVAFLAIPLALPNSSNAVAQTKTCGTPGMAACPGPAPIPGSFIFRSPTTQAWGAGPFDTLIETWLFTAEIDQPNSNHCVPNSPNFSQPGSTWGPTPAYMYSPNVLMAKDSWAIGFTSRAWLNPIAGEQACIYENPGGEEILATRDWVCPNSSSINYSTAPQIGPFCPIPSLTPDSTPPVKAPGDCTGGGGGGGGAGPNSGTTVLGNPCEISNGNKLEKETDYSGVNGLSFTRVYNSLVAYRHFLSSSGLKLRTPLGVAWSATFFQSIVEVPTTDSTGAHSTIHAFRPDGRILSFVKFAGVYVPDADTADQVTMSGGGFTFRTASDTIETYDVQGRLTSITPRGGSTVAVNYASSDAQVPATDLTPANCTS